MSDVGGIVGYSLLAGLVFLGSLAFVCNRQLRTQLKALYAREYERLRTSKQVVAAKAYYQGKVAPRLQSAKVALKAVPERLIYGPEDGSPGFFDLFSSKTARAEALEKRREERRRAREKLGAKEGAASPGAKALGAWRRGKGGGKKMSRRSTRLGWFKSPPRGLPPRLGAIPEGLPPVEESGDKGRRAEARDLEEGKEEEGTREEGKKPDDAAPAAAARGAAPVVGRRVGGDEGRELIMPPPMASVMPLATPAGSQPQRLRRAAPVGTPFDPVPAGLPPESPGSPDGSPEHGSPGGPFGGAGSVGEGAAEAAMEEAMGGAAAPFDGAGVGIGTEGGGAPSSVAMYGEAQQQLTPEAEAYTSDAESSDEDPEERTRRLAWIEHYVSEGQFEDARALGWEGDEAEEA